MLESAYVTSEHELLRDQVAHFVADEVEPHGAEWEEQGSVPREVLRRMGELGFLGLMYSADPPQTVANASEPKIGTMYGRTDLPRDTRYMAKIRLATAVTSKPTSARSVAAVMTVEPTITCVNRKRAARTLTHQRD